MIPFSNEDGNKMNGRIIEITGETVILDFNHPLAGQNMHFSGKILSVRDATKEEIAHGHVHGEGGVIH
jgi:FKBP-type peptidyl-prolyl cis-trans isomerase SlyD